ncbi:hypothetical protein Mhun_3044 [Methanospirillum hungatei JF-1]|jgi:hypothetical protein|uniref:Macroglobulin domain-containing protein n=2 Tax=Methanospirillum hungatei TaxID=2203 RepID=Q2FT71_METHJ|nr:hypothetical protein Mhun_3044 [Methanospirillum hungatei JF-1]
MRNFSILYEITAMMMVIAILIPSIPANPVRGADDQFLNIQAKTDRSYYSPGDIIRIKGTVSGEENIPVQSRLLFQFQGMNTTANTTSNGSFSARVPISLIEPESMYRLIISAHADGYEEKNLSIPIIIMGEPSSLAPAPVIPDEFSSI